MKNTLLTLLFALLFSSAFGQLHIGIVNQQGGGVTITPVAYKTDSIYNPSSTLSRAYVPQVDRGGVDAGDLMIWNASADNLGEPGTNPPTGWTTINIFEGTSDGALQPMSGWIGYKIATVSDETQAFFQVGWTDVTGARLNGQLTVFTAGTFDAANPISGVWSSAVLDDTADTTFSNPNAASEGQMALIYYDIDDNNTNTSVTGTTDYQELYYDSSGYHQLWIMGYNIPNGQTTDTGVVTANNRSASFPYHVTAFYINPLTQ